MVIVEPSDFPARVRILYIFIALTLLSLVCCGIKNVLMWLTTSCWQNSRLSLAIKKFCIWNAEPADQRFAWAGGCADYGLNYSALYFISEHVADLLKLIAQLVKMRCIFRVFILFQLNNGIFINVKSRFYDHKIMRIMLGVCCSCYVMRVLQTISRVTAAFAGEVCLGFKF